jgi:3'-5' exoribonuclease
MKVFVKDLKEGDFLTDQVFSVEELQRHTTRTGNPYYRVVLQDRTGEIIAKIWQDDFTNCHIKNVETGDVVIIDGDISTYNGQLQLTIKKLDKTDEYDITDLLQASERDIDKMFSELRSEIVSVKNTDLKKLLTTIFEDKSFIQLYKRAPAAVMVHHDYIGGLMEHTLEMIDIAKGLLKHYKEADRDLVITGLLLHDIGKVYELEVHNTALRRTAPGKLIGHVVQGIQFVQKKLPKNFPEELWMKIAHIIAAHQHQIELEHGSPVKQATIEAAIVHVADYASSKVRQFQKAIKVGESNDPGFSDYQKWIGTQVYLD